MSEWTPIILVELVLVFGGVTGWGLWELRSLRRLKAQREQAVAGRHHRAGPDRADGAASATPAGAAAPGPTGDAPGTR